MDNGLHFNEFHLIPFLICVLGVRKPDNSMLIRLILIEMIHKAGT